VLTLSPVDTEDLRFEPVGRWLLAAETVPEERARAVVEEHVDG
jgi:hypothetical protein